MNSMITNLSVDGLLTKSFVYLFEKPRGNVTLINRLLAIQNAKLGKCQIKEINLLWTEAKTSIDIEVFRFLIVEVRTSLSSKQIEQIGENIDKFVKCTDFYWMRAFT